MYTESTVPVSADMSLFVAQSVGDRPLLVIHGGPDWDHTYLRSPVDKVPAHVVMPDLRGCGRSGKAAEYTPDLAVTDLLGLLDVLGIEQTDILGFSYGGMLAQRLTLREPHRVRKLIIASSSVVPVPADAFAGWHERDELRKAEAEVWASYLTGPSLTRAAAFAGAPANVWRNLPEYLRILAGVRFSAEWVAPWLEGRLPPARPENASSRLGTLGIPILLLHGRYDMIFPPPPDGVVLDDAGHMAHIDQPELWLQAVEEFLNS
ncbi:hydrolase [Lentzea sp. NBRC 105346]|uniref:alpha/beta fold hydrolase n=1 Tax=Lentzea sp. NBRC 105346 TaxID=3032205 RepID=UPI0024A2B47B|nr:alpha/beta hydrolase [Lentzea sp. NBRC 105346]GLZ34714.1 hydrolase [Lentzea sp. NBRC 105346]